MRYKVNLYLDLLEDGSFVAHEVEVDEWRVDYFGVYVDPEGKEIKAKLTAMLDNWDGHVPSKWEVERGLPWEDYEIFPLE